MEALENFKVPNTVQDPTPFPYLQHENSCNFDIKLEVDIKSKLIEISPFFIFHTQRSRVPIAYNYNFYVTAASGVKTTICQSNFKHMYWTPQQQLAHQTITGCNVNPGDLIASGTISGDVCSKFKNCYHYFYKICDICFARNANYMIM